MRRNSPATELSDLPPAALPRERLRLIRHTRDPAAACTPCRSLHSMPRPALHAAVCTPRRGLLPSAGDDAYGRDENACFHKSYKTRAGQASPLPRTPHEGTRALLSLPPPPGLPLACALSLPPRPVPPLPSFAHGMRSSVTPLSPAMPRRQEKGCPFRDIPFCYSVSARRPDAPPFPPGRRNRRSGIRGRAPSHFPKETLRHDTGISAWPR